MPDPFILLPGEPAYDNRENEQNEPKRVEPALRGAGRSRIAELRRTG